MCERLGRQLQEMQLQQKRLKVTIGLIEGEWVEIKEGLVGDELIIVDIVSGSAAKAS